MIENAIDHLKGDDQLFTDVESRRIRGDRGDFQ